MTYIKASSVQEQMRIFDSLPENDTETMVMLDIGPQYKILTISRDKYISTMRRAVYLANSLYPELSEDVQHEMARQAYIKFIQNVIYNNKKIRLE